jgi:RNA polymerase sigma-70 factor, ECF subfamily
MPNNRPSVKEDVRLLEKFRKRDERAFDTFYGKFAPRVLAFALLLTRSRTDAEDLTQETFLAAYSGATKFQNRSSLLSWLFSITKRKFRDGKRTPRPHFDELTEHNSPHISSGDNNILSRMCLLTALDTLPDPEREAFILVAIQQCTYAEAAQTLQSPIGTVKWRVFEATKKMRLALAPDLPQVASDLPPPAREGGTSKDSTISISEKKEITKTREKREITDILEITEITNP